MRKLSLLFLTVFFAFIVALSIGIEVHAANAVHTVKKGDTLWAISKKYGTTVQSLQKTNHLSGNLIRVGQKLVIPSNGKASSPAPKKPAAPSPSKSTTPKSPVTPQPSGKKVVYLTFDDGPNKYTPQILDLLKKHNMKATFFMLEPNMRTYKSTVQRVKREGHSIGLHGVTHEKTKVYRSPTSFVGEMNKGNQTLKSITGQGTRIIRTPYGSKPYFTESFRNASAKAGYRFWDWHVDSGDTKSSRVTSSYVINNTINQMKGKNEVVLLFHDKYVTVQSLPTILSYLQKNGYETRVITGDIKPHNFWKDFR